MLQQRILLLRHDRLFVYCVLLFQKTCRGVKSKIGLQLSLNFNSTILRVADIAPEFALLKTLNTEFTNPYSLTAAAI